MAFDFPNSPSIGQTYTVAGITYVWDGLAWSIATNPSMFFTALERNYIVNPAMQIAQETIASVGSGGYPVDQFTISSAIATVIASRQPVSGPDALAACATSVSTAKPSLAATDVWHMLQSLEGLQMADFRWGTSQAKPAVMRFWAYSNQAGTYTAYVKNNDASRNFLAPFTLPAGAYKEIVIPIPGDTAGTWAIDTARWGLIGWGLAAGTTYNQGVPGWQASGQVQIAGNTSLAQTAGNAFYVAKVGLYLDPDGTGRAPPWVLPDYGEELMRCQRYFRAWPAGDMFVSAAYAPAGGVVYQNNPFDPPMRVTPTASFSSWSYSNASGVSTNGSYVDNLRLQINVSALGSCYGYGAVNANARM